MVKCLPSNDLFKFPTFSACFVLFYSLCAFSNPHISGYPLEYFNMFCNRLLQAKKSFFLWIAGNLKVCHVDL